MTDFSPEQGARLLELTDEKKELIDEFFRLTSQQSRLLEDEDIDLMNLNLTHRQRIIEKVNALHQELDPLMQSYRESVNSPEALKISQRVEAAEKEIARILEDCRAMDKVNTQAAQKLMAEFGRKAKKSSDSAKTISVYKTGGYDTSEFFDKKQ